VPQKYPGKKYFKGPKRGQYSANPLGKNPGDVWVIPNVKHNHPEKTIHPCQFPVELVERLILSLTHPADIVLDPYMGSGSTLVAAILNGRKCAGAEIDRAYVDISRRRAIQAFDGTISLRPRTRPVYTPPEGSTLTQRPWLEA
jgi:adenine-specific DNA-methyltransferase